MVSTGVPYKLRNQIANRFLPKYRRTMSFVLEGQAETHRHYQEIIDAHRLPDSAQGCSHLHDGRERGIVANADFAFPIIIGRHF